MRAYLITTGTLFALLALADHLRTVAVWPRLPADPWFGILTSDQRTRQKV
jgi:hypothetical protein